MMAKTIDSHNHKKNSPANISRRQFLAGAASALAAPYFVPATALGRSGLVPPSEPVGRNEPPRVGLKSERSGRTASEGLRSKWYSYSATRGLPGAKST